MIAAVDLHYLPGDRARAAGVVFGAWADGAPASEHVIEVGGVAPYVPGELYRRELPGILAVLAEIPARLEVVIVDAYVWLGPDETHPGLGAHLYRTLGGAAAVVGVAKTRFRAAEDALPVLRGISARPLWVSAVGMPVAEAARLVGSMHGPARTPTLLGRVDRLARSSG